MQASELYDLGCKSYNGDKAARREWFALLAPLAVKAAKPYSVLPSLLLGKAAIESGFASDLYEKSLEVRFGVKMARKAQKHNNLVGMNCFEPNQRYLRALPLPAWTTYRETFADYGPHWHNGSYVLTKDEPWKHYRIVEHCLEDWCANIRSQAEEHGKKWGSTLKEQLLAIESYTPEGVTAKTPGMHFDWQDTILEFAEDYNLYLYDMEVTMEVVKMTQKNLDAHIKKAYEYTHKHCTYGPSGTRFPPADPPEYKNDCVGLVFRAFYTMGRYPHPYTIDQVVDLCRENGLIYSTDENDIWKRHAVACYRDKHNKGMIVNHVYYSLGGTGLNDIAKYDLGSDERIQAVQPFTHVRVNEWEDRRDFLCCLYLPDEKLPDVPHFEVESETLGVVTKSAGFYAGPGTAFRKIGTVTEGDDIILRGYVTNGAGNLWRAVRYKGEQGFVGSAAAKPKAFTAYNAFVKGTDGTLALRAGAGGGCYKVGDIKEGKAVRVDGKAKSEDGTEWLHVKASIDGKPMRGFAAAKYVVKSDK